MGSRVKLNNRLVELQKKKAVQVRCTAWLLFLNGLTAFGKQLSQYLLSSSTIFQSSGGQYYLGRIGNIVMRDERRLLVLARALSNKDSLLILRRHH